LAKWPAAVPDDAAMRAIRAEVLQKLATRRLWGARLGWAAVLIVAAGALVAGWQLDQHRPMPEFKVRFEPPGVPQIDLRMPQSRVLEPAAPVPRFVQRKTKLETPAVRIGAIIPADPETGTGGGVMYELESKNPSVVLYFLAGSQGD
jgi:hypothetical protein